MNRAHPARQFLCGRRLRGNRGVHVVLWAVLASGALPSAHADSEEAAITVGSERMTVVDIERRLGSMPPFQRRTLGKTPEEVKTAFVEQVLVPELLYAAEAKQRGLERDPGIRARHDQLLARSVEEQIRDAARTPGPTEAEIQGYYDAHSKQYNSPIRIRVWRIVVADEAGAKAILDQVKGQGPAGVTKWRQLARDKSLDKTTAMRDGDVGLVYPDGTTESGRVKVDPKLFAAASQVKDGELCAAPVKIDAGWAVLWRRGSLPAVRRTLANEKVTIARQLERESADKERRELLARLRSSGVKDLHPELLQNIAVSTFGSVGTPGRPGGLPGRVPTRARPSPASAAPQPSSR